MSGRSQTTGTAGGETHCGGRGFRWFPPCSRGSWGRNTRGCCARPEDSSSILAARTRSGGGVKGQSGAKQNRRRLDDSLSTTLQNLRQNLRFSVCGKYRKKKREKKSHLGGSGVWKAVHSLCRGDVGTLRDKIWRFQRQETC